MKCESYILLNEEIMSKAKLVWKETVKECCHNLLRSNVF